MIKKRQKKAVGFNAFITVTILLLMMLFATGYSLYHKQSELTYTNRVLDVEQQKNQELEKQGEKLELQLQEIEMQLDEKQQQIEQLKEQMKELQVTSIGKKQNGNYNVSKEKVAYLTFDDGPSKNTPAILDFLKEHQIPATFFVIGKENKTDIYKRMIDEGHTIGNHTYGHNYNGIYRSPEAFFEDVDKLNDLLEMATGQRTKILRFPGGSNNTVSRHSGGNDIMYLITAQAREKGYRYFDWNVDSQDATKTTQSKQVIVQSVIRGAQYTDQAVILMHDAPTKTTTVEALPEIVNGLKKQGFIFKALTEDTPEVQFQ